MAYLQCTFVTGSSCTLSVKGSGSLANPTLFSVDGANGRLLEVTDDLSCSIFSANTIAGLPVIEAFANYCVSMGQYGGHKFEVTCTSIRGGKCTTASGACSVVVGGCCNVVTGNGIRSFIGGGRDNCADIGDTTIVGGNGNRIACGHSYGFIGGGVGNVMCALGDSTASTIVGGNANTMSNYGIFSAFIGAGVSNTISGYGSGLTTITGGGYNTISGNYARYSTISGGYYNTISGNYACGQTIGGGSYNTVAGAHSFVGGGLNNSNSGYYSSILGGRDNAISFSGGLGLSNVHIIGSCIAGALVNSNNYTYVNNLCQTGGGISDCRVKNTIQPLEFGLDHIAQLQPVSWCWNGDKSCHKKYGFIAQNVQQAMSCVVTCNKLHKLGPDGTQVLNGEEGEPLLEFEKDAVYASYANAFKELKAENDALKQRITAIENILKNNNLL